MFSTVITLRSSVSLTNTGTDITKRYTLLCYVEDNKLQKGKHPFKEPFHFLLELFQKLPGTLAISLWFMSFVEYIS